MQRFIKPYFPSLRAAFQLSWAAPISFFFFVLVPSPQRARSTRTPLHSLQVARTQGWNPAVASTPYCSGDPGDRAQVPPAHVSCSLGHAVLQRGQGRGGPRPRWASSSVALLLCDLGQGARPLWAVSSDPWRESQCSWHPQRLKSDEPGDMLGTGLGR